MSRTSQFSTNTHKHKHTRTHTHLQLFVPDWTFYHHLEKIGFLLSQLQLPEVTHVWNVFFWSNHRQVWQTLINQIWHLLWLGNIFATGFYGYISLSYICIVSNGSSYAYLKCMKRLNKRLLSVFKCVVLCSLDLFFLWIRTSFVLMTKSWNISTKLWFWAASLIIKCVIHVLSHVCTWELGLLVSPWWWTERTAVAGSHWTQAHLWGWSWSEQFQLCRCWIGRSTGLQLLVRESCSPLGRSDLCRERRWTGYRQKKKVRRVKEANRFGWF